MDKPEVSRCIIFTGHYTSGGEPDALRIVDKQPVLVLCADGGYITCKAAGIRPDAVIGDFDSLSEELIREIDELGIERVSYPEEKDDTDTLLSVKYGLSKGYSSFVIIGGIGGDFGHTIANLQVLSFLKDTGCEAEIVTQSERLKMADAEEVQITGKECEKFSVFSFSERCTGVSIKNAKYELKDVIMTQSYPVGVSNEFLNSEPVTVLVRSGRLLIVQKLC